MRIFTPGRVRCFCHGENNFEEEKGGGWFVKWGYYYIVWQIDQNCRCGKPSMISFKDGVPSQCSCAVDKSVPSNAVFTDRTASIITKKFYKGKVTIGDHGTTDIP
ncbi:MAG: hypothetical protein V8S38_12255 [Lachnospiraceae bacterium]